MQFNDIYELHKTIKSYTVIIVRVNNNIISVTYINKIMISPEDCTQLPFANSMLTNRYIIYVYICKLYVISIIY